MFHMWPERAGAPAHLIGVDAVVDGPGGLEVLQHALLELLGQAVDADEVLQVLHPCVVERAAGVHALDDGSHVAKDQGVHQSWGVGRGDGRRGEGTRLVSEQASQEKMQNDFFLQLLQNKNSSYSSSYYFY